MLCALASLLAAAISLTGVTGRDLRARAFLDANNVKVGDPLVLTVDFVGQAEFRNLHPPALSRHVSRKDWKLDDASAKTDTYRDARRLTYRVRPMRDGVLWFPSLEFAYTDETGAERTVRSNEIPVHAKRGEQVVVAEMGENLNALPKPPELVSAVKLDDEDLAFAWRKALANPTAEGFEAFDFPEAKMNAATMCLRNGNWARALAIYGKLEWQIGQTPEIERGIVAALALKHDSAAVELPVWRQVLRPVLRFAWPQRVGIVGGFVLALAVAFVLLGRLVRALACLGAVVLLVGTARAETVEAVTTNADGAVVHRKVVTSGNGSSFSFSVQSGGRGTVSPSLFDESDEVFASPFGSRRASRRRQPVTIGVDLTADKQVVTVGETFNLVLSLEIPRFVSLDEGVGLSIVEQNRMAQVGKGQPLRNRASRNPTNIIQRLVFPMRANEPFTNLHYSVEGAYAYVGESFFFRQSQSFASGRRTASLTVSPLPADGRPADFSGIVASSLALHETCDILSVETNDVVTVTYRLRPNGGYVPAQFLPKDAAFEWVRQTAPDGRLAEVEYRRYFVASGEAETPRLVVSYYDPEEKCYKTASAGGTPLRYHTEGESK